VSEKEKLIRGDPPKIALKGRGEPPKNQPKNLFLLKIIFFEILAI
jgi:hypothetical protein